MNDYVLITYLQISMLISEMRQSIGMGESENVLVKCSYPNIGRTSSAKLAINFTSLDPCPKIAGGPIRYADLIFVL